MPTAKQLNWIRENADVVPGGPILDIGSRIPESRKGSKVQRFTVRDAFTERGEESPAPEITGVDLIDGPGVDVVLDLSKPMTTAALKKAGLIVGGYQAIYCLSVLEHVRDVFQFAKQAQRLLAPGGWLFVSVPFCWRYHGHPDDYWRFTPQAVDFLFQGLELQPGRSEIWAGGIDERTVATIDETRKYANRLKKLLEPVTVNRVYRKAE
jgi:SAM-dependent methyltransferase